MNKDKSLKEEVDRLVSLKGNTTGEVFKTHAIYIKYREGEEGVRAVEKKMAELGYPIKFKEFVPLAWYSEGKSIAVVLVAKEIFNWTDEDIFEMGNSAPKYSFIVKLFAQHFLSPEKILSEAQKYWQKHFDFGDVKVIEFNKEEKRIIVRVIGYKTHPIACKFHAGYLLRMGQFVLKSDNIKVEETKCVYRGDPYHEYSLTWE
jgi:predicted hydrocarbon binding protein